MKGAQPVEGFVRLVCFKLKGQVCSCHESSSCGRRIRLQIFKPLPEPTWDPKTFNTTTHLIHVSFAINHKRLSQPCKSWLMESDGN